MNIILLASGREGGAQETLKGLARLVISLKGFTWLSVPGVLRNSFITFIIFLTNFVNSLAVSFPFRSLTYSIPFPHSLLDYFF